MPRRWPALTVPVLLLASRLAAAPPAVPVSELDVTSPRSGSPAGSSAIWRQLEPGLELARFSVADTAAAPDGELVVLRIDPVAWRLELHAADAASGPRARAARDWCAEFHLTAAINAGMYQEDGRTHVGYLACDDHLHSALPNGYQSAAAFAPRQEGLPPFRIFDLDETPLAAITADYRCVVQNLRLIKRPREVRWHLRDRRWREAALGEDGAGRALFIYCQAALTMPDFGELLLALPLDLQAAQHLEGGAEAQLHVAHPAADTALRAEGRWLAWPVPNVLGVVPAGEHRGGAENAGAPRAPR